jgi:hypothetical protein
VTVAEPLVTETVPVLYCIGSSWAGWGGRAR